MRVEIEVPTSLEDITLDKYQRFNKVNTEENKDSSFLLHKTVQIFCGLDLKDTLKIKYSSVSEIIERLNKIFENTPELTKTFTFKGIEYGFIPNLDDMTLGEYVDLDDTFGDWDNMHKAMAVLYRPITNKSLGRYLIEDYKGSDNAENFKGLPLSIVFGTTFFFYNLSNELLKTTLSYLKKELPETLTTQELQALEQNGDSINLFTEYPKATFLDLIK
jgi:hypothetical protein